MSVVDDGENFETFRDCLSISTIAKLSSSNTQKARKRTGRKRKSVRKDDSVNSNNEDQDSESVSELSEFVEVGCVLTTRALL